MIPKRLLTVEEAAQAIGVGRTAVYELLMSGQLESVRLGRSRRIPVAALDEFVERLRAEARELDGDVRLRAVARGGGP